MNKIFRALLLAVLATLLTAPIVRANSINAQIYRSPLNLNYGMIEGARNDNSFDDQINKGDIFFSANYNYVKDPIVEINTATNQRISSLLSYYNTVDLAAGYFFRPDLSLFVQLPVDYAKLPGASSAVEISDTRIVGKYAIIQDDGPFSLALMPELTVPTGDKGYFLSDGSVTGGAMLVAEKNFSLFRLSANLGYRYSPKATYATINYKNRMPVGLGADIPLAQKWSLNPEFLGQLSFPTSNQQNPGEFYLGGNFHPRQDIAFIGGASLGTLNRQGSLNYRFQLALRMFLGEPKPAQAAIATPAPTPTPTPEPTPAPKKPKAVYTNKKIEVMEQINFEHNKATLTESAKAILDDVCAIIVEHKADIQHLSIEGHTSLVGSVAYNDALSLRRAKAVKEYLVTKGIPDGLLGVKGYGKQRPKYLPGKASKAELELNRRVEFVVTPTKVEDKN